LGKNKKSRVERILLRFSSERPDGVQGKKLLFTLPSNATPAFFVGGAKKKNRGEERGRGWPRKRSFGEGWVTHRLQKIPSKGRLTVQTDEAPKNINQFQRAAKKKGLERKRGRRSENTKGDEEEKKTSFRKRWFCRMFRLSTVFAENRGKKPNGNSGTRRRGTTPYVLKGNGQKMAHETANTLSSAKGGKVEKGKVKKKTGEKRGAQESGLRRAKIGLGVGVGKNWGFF